MLFQHSLEFPKEKEKKKTGMSRRSWLQEKQAHIECDKGRPGSECDVTPRRRCQQ